jgi:hypothetical protein
MKKTKHPPWKPYERYTEDELMWFIKNQKSTVLRVFKRYGYWMEYRKKHKNGFTTTDADDAEQDIIEIILQGLKEWNPQYGLMTAITRVALRYTQRRKRDREKWLYPITDDQFGQKYTPRTKSQKTPLEIVIDKEEYDEH